MGSDPGILDRLYQHVSKNWHVIMQAKSLFGAASVLLIGVTAVVTWIAATKLDEAEIGGLRATISNLQAQIQFQQSRLDVLSAKSAPGEVGAGVARIDYVDIQVLNGEPLSFHLRLSNRGNAAAIGGFHAETGAMTEVRLTNAAIDKAYADLAQELNIKDDRSSTSEIQPNHTFSLTIEMSGQQRSDFDSSVLTKKFLYYMFFIMDYADWALPPGKWRRTEICMVYWGDTDGRFCDVHNRTIMFDKPASP